MRVPAQAEIKQSKTPHNVRDAKNGRVGLKRVTPVLFAGKGPGECEYDSESGAFVSELIVHNFYNLSALLLLVDAERKLSSVVKHPILLP